MLSARVERARKALDGTSDTFAFVFEDQQVVGWHGRLRPSTLSKAKSYQHAPFSLNTTAGFSGATQCGANCTGTTCASTFSAVCPAGAGGSANLVSSSNSGSDTRLCFTASFPNGVAYGGPCQLRKGGTTACVWNGTYLNSTYYFISEQVGSASGAIVSGDFICWDNN